MNNFRAYISDLISLTKPPIISLLLVTAIGAIFLASNGSPSLFITIYILIGGTLGAAGANSFGLNTPAESNDPNAIGVSCKPSIKCTSARYPVNL